MGKTFEVDDGFLKKIRVAKIQPGRTRVVLEVDDLASYDAFLLPDPYRLIIDVHGKDLHGKNRAAADVGTKGDTAADSTEADDDSSATAALDEGSKAGRRTQPESEKDAAGLARPGAVETDLPAQDAGAQDISAHSKPSDSPKPSNRGVIKTTVAVKGSDRRIPKTIVNADDDSKGNRKLNSKNKAPSTVATPDDEKISPEKTTVADANIPDDVKVAQSESPSPTSSSSSSSSSPPAPSSRSSAHRKKSRAAAAASDTADLHPDIVETTREARPTASGDRSLTRALGLKIGKIVIDAGHGGHDTGTIGPNGLLEKDVVLDVAKRLGRLLESRLGAEVIYTRQDDTFVPLETRTAIANRERADLFISIHANSSRDSDARGVETYYLNFTSSPEALEVAARENAVSEKSIHELQDLVKKIALKEKIEESREFAGDVQQSLYGGLSLNNAGIRNRGIKKAPFIVLIGANMPSILAEISFVSNPTDERKLETSEHRQRIAESLYRGVSKYVNGLSGVKVASKIDKPEGQ